MSNLETEDEHLTSMAFAAEESAESTDELSLFDISWTDVLITNVACHLTLKDIFNLRCCSKVAKSFAEAAFEHLKEINFSGNNNKNIDVAFAVLAKNCRKLTSLLLAHCYWLTDDLLLPILAKNTRLRVVNLNHCNNVTTKALQPIIIDCKELRVLKLSKCQWLTTGAVDALTLHQNNLIEFDISHCAAIGERCLIIFFRKLNKLSVLSLANTQSVTDQVLIQIAHHCIALEHLNLVGCEAISDYGIHAIFSYCTRLQTLLIQYCPHVTEFVLAPLRKRIYIDRPNPLLFNQNDFYPTDFLIY